MNVFFTNKCNIILLLLIVFMSVLNAQQEPQRLEYRYLTLTDSYQVSNTDGNRQFDIVIPATYNSKEVTHIGSQGFRYGQLTSIFLPHTIRTIYDYAFANNARLSSITIPAGVIYIEPGILINNPGLRTLVYNHKDVGDHFEQQGHQQPSNQPTRIQGD